MERKEHNKNKSKYLNKQMVWAAWLSLAAGSPFPLGLTCGAKGGGQPSVLGAFCRANECALISHCAWLSAH